MAEHTKTPWFALGATVHPDRKGLESLVAIATCPTRRGVTDKAHAEADAAFIVTAVNNHDALAAALGRATDEGDCPDCVKSIDYQHHPECNTAALLRTVRGE